jgi:uncharacterized protein
MEALAGARDIIAEKMSEDSEVRLRMRSLYEEKGELRTKAASGKAEEAAKYRDYLDWSEPISRMPSHRLLAILRGAKEGLLSVFVDVPQEEAEWIMQEPYLEPDASRQQPSTRTRRNAMPAGSSEQIELAAKDGLKRLIGPSIENESLQSARERAEAVASSVFAKNLRELLIEAPLGEKRVLAVDPGFRTGCKLAVLDGGGRLLDHGAIFPHDQGPAREKAAGIVKEICKRHAVEVIAVGNGTAGRETEAFLRSIGLQKNVSIVMVNESGASIYSASNLAREEFPQLDVTVRGAISIGRRLLDPLAELVKIDPSALGIGQYQHDVDPALLKSRLDEVIESCVDQVGVELNTASKELLGRVSGIGPKLAAAIVKFREENGAFTSRKDLLAVPRLGPKAFEQAAGFLRIRDAENPLDASAVHPESYHIVERMAKDLGVGISDLVKSGELRKKIRLQQYVTKTVGLPTLQDIASELERPGRDPRAAFEAFSFKEGIEKLEDLKPGMKLPGIVTNVTAFGAFVDVGVHQDGLVHISQLHDGFVRSPEDIVRPRQRVIVTVLEVDKERRRISLSMRNNASKESKAGTMRDSMQG